jgi:hypothetical protein
VPLKICQSSASAINAACSPAPPLRPVPQMPGAHEARHDDPNLCVLLLALPRALSQPELCPQLRAWLPFRVWGHPRKGKGRRAKASRSAPLCFVAGAGKVLVGEPVAMRRPIRLVPLDRTMQLPLTLAGGLRTTFADVLSSPLPDRLAALMRRLSADRDERSGGRNHGASATETSSRIGRRGRR